jgi:hypothetical protein
VSSGVNPSGTIDAVLHPGDVFFTRGTSLLSKAIRFFTRGIGEKRTLVNHVGIVVEPGQLSEAIVVEALVRVRRHRLWERYSLRRRTEVAVYRPLNLEATEIQKIIAKAESYVGRKYGWEMIIAHFLDWLFLGVYLFRRLVGSDDYPICSWVVAHAFAAADKTFGKPAGAASPDDIWDFVDRNHDKFAQVRGLLPLADSQGTREVKQARG